MAQYDLARNQVQRQIANSRSDFQDAASHVRPDHVRHPARKARRAVQTQQDFSAMPVGGVNFIGRGVAENGPKRAHAIFPIDLLAFGVGSVRNS